MDLPGTYLNKHAQGDSLILTIPEKDLKFIVVIPSYIETGLINSLVSLFNADCPDSPVEIIVIVNWPENDTPGNIKISEKCFSEAEKWASEHSTQSKRFYIVKYGNIPAKKAGVGLARKIGMDEAVRRFLQVNQNDGIIISFDADTTCEKNYFTAIQNHFSQNSSISGCSIFFEHPIEGTEYDQLVYKSVISYELHLRCYLEGIRYTRFPNAFHTVGSAFAVRANSYCMQGGMNTRKAGEDFYFLQKFFELGNFSDLVSTKVIPSPRASLRVPFGTGKAIDQLLKEEGQLKSYDPEIYNILKDFFSNISRFYLLLSDNQEIKISNKCLSDFLDKSDFQREIKQIFQNSGNFQSFIKRFYRYFNMFRILKYVNHARLSFPDIPVADSAKKLLLLNNIDFSRDSNERDLLLRFREWERNSTGLQ